MATRLIVNAGSWAGAWGLYWAGSWGIWGYNADGTPIEVYEPQGVSSSDGDDEDPIVEHAKARGEAGRKQYAPPKPVEGIHEIEATPSVVTEPVPAPQPDLPAIDVSGEVAAVLDAAKQQVESLRLKRQREEEMMLLAMLDC